MALSIMDIMDAGRQAAVQGRERGKQTYLGKLAGQAYGAAPDQQRGIVQQAITTNPDAGFSLAGALGKTQDRDFSQLGQAAAIFSTISDEQKQEFYASKLAPLAKQAGYPVPETYDPRFQQAIDKIAQIGGGLGKSAELQTFGAMTQGMSPEDVQKARRIQLGLDPRAVTGAMKFDTFQGADGRPRPQRNNPTTGGIEIFYDEAGQWVPLGQAQGQQSAAPAQQRAPGEVPFSIDPSLPPQVQAQIRANPDAGSAQGITSLQTSFGGQPQQGGALPPPLDYQNGGQRVPGLGVGRSPEEQAALTTSAQEAAKLTFLPTQGRIEADNAAAKKEAEQSVERMPPAVMTMVQELEEKASTAEGILDRMKGHRQKIAQGKLDFGPIANQTAKARNFLGASDEQSRNFQLFMSDLEKMRNDSLRLNNGVQTEGDAQRAWNELFANLNDKEYVLAGLDRIDKINQRAAQLYKQQAAQVRQSYPGGRGPAQAQRETPQSNSVLRYNPATGDFE